MKPTKRLWNDYEFLFNEIGKYTENFFVKIETTI